MSERLLSTFGIKKKKTLSLCMKPNASPSKKRRKENLTCTEAAETSSVLQQPAFKKFKHLAESSCFDANPVIHSDALGATSSDFPSGTDIASDSDATLESTGHVDDASPPKSRRPSQCPSAVSSPSVAGLRVFHCHNSPVRYTKQFSPAKLKQYQPVPEPSIPMVGRGGTLLTVTPAYVRFKHLVEEQQTSKSKSPSLTTPSTSAASTPSSTVKARGTEQSASTTERSKLTLPKTHLVLLENYRDIENIVYRINSRQQPCTFKELKSAMETYAKRPFTENVIAQILQVDSRALQLRYVQLQPKYEPKALKVWELVVETRAFAEPGTLPEKNVPSVGVQLVQRVQDFREKLLLQVDKYHRTFLMEEFGLDGDELPPLKAMQRWHPTFPLEGVPAIPPQSQSLPQCPALEHHRLMTAKDVIQRFRDNGKHRVAEVCEGALAAVPSSASASSTVPLSDISSPSSSSVAAPSESARQLASIDSKLLERIRKREVEALKVDSWESHRRCVRISRLPQMAAILWQMVQDDRRRQGSDGGRPMLIRRSRLLQTIVDSHPSELSLGDALVHVKLLIGIVPHWLEERQGSEPRQLCVKAVDCPLSEIHGALREALQAEKRRGR